MDERNDPQCWSGSSQKPGCVAPRLQARIAELERALSSVPRDILTFIEHCTVVFPFSNLPQDLIDSLDDAVKAIPAAPPAQAGEKNEEVKHG